MQVWAVIKTIIAAIPGVIKLLGMIKDAWDKYNDYRVQEHYRKKKEARQRLLERLKNARTDEERKEIAELLSIIDSEYNNI